MTSLTPFMNYLKFFLTSCGSPLMLNFYYKRLAIYPKNPWDDFETWQDTRGGWATKSKYRMVVISLYLHQVKKVRKNLVVIAYELSKEYPHEREAGQYWQIAILLTFCATTRFLPASLSKKKTCQLFLFSQIAAIFLKNIIYWGKPALLCRGSFFFNKTLFSCTMWHTKLLKHCCVE